MENKTGKLACAIIALFTSAIMLLININVFSALTYIDSLDAILKIYTVLKLITEIIGILFTLLNVAILAGKQDVRGLGYLTVISNFCLACTIFSLSMCVYDGQKNPSSFPYIDLLCMVYSIVIMIGYGACNKIYPSASAQRIKQNEEYVTRLEKEYDEQSFPSMQPQRQQQNVTTETLTKELKSYKTLLDDGAITQEEYDKIKASYLADFQRK